MFCNFGFVNFNAESGGLPRFYCATVFVNGITFGDYIVTPGDIGVYCFADDVGWRGKTKGEGGRCAYRSLGIVWCDCNAVTFSHGGYAPGFAQSAAVGDIGLDDAAGAQFKQFSEVAFWTAAISAMVSGQQGSSKK